MFQKVVVANRGAVAARVLRTLKAMNVRSVAVFSEADAGAPYLAEADEAYFIGPSPARESYLRREALLDVVGKSRADAVHPGYGFLSENAEFALGVEKIGAHFIGPSSRWLATMGHKTRARDLARQHGLPVAMGSRVLSESRGELRKAAERVGFPLLVKPAGGGGGIGMVLVNDAEQLIGAVEKAQSMALRSFGNAEVYLEKYFERPRHVEFQLLGDRYGNVRQLFDRDCSVQRRHQKVIEEACAPAVDRERIEALANHMARTFSELGYDNIGTVEMLMAEDGSFSFLEMNTRLQVEHGVTEEVTGIDLVAAQIRSAAGETLGEILPSEISISGHAIEARVYAEDSIRFLPSPGRLTVFRPPVHSGVRFETGYAEGREVTMHYDPLLAKVIAHGPTREAATRLLRRALSEFEVAGVKTNLDALDEILGSCAFRRGEVHTSLISELKSGKG